eukprot:2502119-Pyramimonas_sp.AAC.1
MPAAARECAVSKCREVGRRAKHCMCLHIKKALKDAQDEATVLRAIKDYTGRNMRWAKHTWNNRDVWKGTVTVTCSSSSSSSSGSSSSSSSS